MVLSALLRWLSKLGLVAFFFLACGLPLESKAEVYLSKTEALELVLGKESEQVYEKHVLSRAVKTDLIQQGLLSHTMKHAHFFVGKQQGRVRGYALIDNEVGKHLPITYIVGISPIGEITRVEMMVFREVRGWEARERRFMRQFEGKELGDSLSIGASLRNVSGATLSSRAIAKGVKRALYLWRLYYGDTQGDG